MTKALIPGTFDPATNGHLDVIERAARLFDEVVVSVAASPSKRLKGTLFSIDERVSMLERATDHLPNVKVKSFSNLLTDFAQTENAEIIIKGLRAVTDFESEFQMASLNWRLGGDIETMFIMAVPENMYLSSSAVKEIAQHGGDVSELVPEGISELLVKKIKETY